MNISAKILDLQGLPNLTAFWSSKEEALKSVRLRTGVFEAFEVRPNAWILVEETSKKCYDVLGELHVTLEELCSNI